MAEGTSREEGLRRGGGVGRGPRFRESGQAAVEYAIAALMLSALALLLLRTVRVWQELLSAGITRILGITVVFL